MTIKFKHISLALYILAALMLASPLSYAQQSARMSYTDAYNTCAPVATQITKEQCNYANAYQSYYLNCMASQGFADTNNFNQDYYDNYLKAYNYCSSVSEQKTQDSCSYGSRYKLNYNQCMRKHGYDAYGQPIDPQSGGRGFQFDF